MDIHIIGLIGAKGAGKSTAYDILSYTLNTREIMLAWKLKTVCSSVLCIDVDDFNDPNIKEVPFDIPVVLNAEDIGYILRKFGVDKERLPVTVLKHSGTILTSPRHAAQYIGTEILRDIDYRIHIKHAMETVTEGKLNVVTDIRFQDELEAFKDRYRNFKLIYIQNDKAEAAAENDTHLSEKGLRRLRMLADITVHNNDDMHAFDLSLFTELSEILGPIARQSLNY